MGMGVGVAGRGGAIGPEPDDASPTRFRDRGRDDDSPRDQRIAIRGGRDFLGEPDRYDYRRGRSRSPPHRGSGSGSTGIPVNLNLDQMVAMLFEMRGTLAHEVEARRTLESQLSESRRTIEHLKELEVRDNNKWMNLIQRVKEIEVASKMEGRMTELAIRQDKYSRNNDQAKIMQVFQEVRMRMEAQERDYRDSVTRLAREAQRDAARMDADIRARIDQSIQAFHAKSQSDADTVSRLTSRIQDVEKELGVFINAQVLLQQNLANNEKDGDWLKIYLTENFNAQKAATEIKFQEVLHRIEGGESKVDSTTDKVHAEIASLSTRINDLRSEMQELMAEERAARDTSDRKIQKALKVAVTNLGESIKTAVSGLDTRLSDTKRAQSEAITSLHHSTVDLTSRCSELQSRFETHLTTFNQLATDAATRSQSQQSKLDALEEVLKAEIKSRLKSSAKNKTAFNELAHNLSKRFKEVETRVEDTRKNMEDARKDMEQRMDESHKSMEQRVAESQTTLDSKTNALTQSVEERTTQLTRTVEDMANELQRDVASKTAALSQQLDERTNQLTRDVDSKLSELSASVEGQSHNLTNMVQDKVLDLASDVERKVVQLRSWVDQLHAERDAAEAERRLTDTRARQSKEEQDRALHISLETRSVLDSIVGQVEESHYLEQRRQEWKAFGEVVENELKTREANMQARLEETIQTLADTNKVAEQVQEVRTFVEQQFKDFAEAEKAAKEHEEEQANLMHIAMECRATLDGMVELVAESEEQQTRHAMTMGLRNLEAQAIATQEQLTSMKSLLDTQTTSLENSLTDTRDETLRLHTQLVSQVEESTNQLDNLLIVQSTQNKMLDNIKSSMEENADNISMLRSKELVHLRSSLDDLTDQLDRCTKDLSSLKNTTHTRFNETVEASEGMGREMKNIKLSLSEAQDTLAVQTSQLRNIQASMSDIGNNRPSPKPESEGKMASRGRGESLSLDRAASPSALSQRQREELLALQRRVDGLERSQSDLQSTSDGLTSKLAKVDASTLGIQSQLEELTVSAERKIKEVRDKTEENKEEQALANKKIHKNLAAIVGDIEQLHESVQSLRAGGVAAAAAATSAPASSNKLSEEQVADLRSKLASQSATLDEALQDIRSKLSTQGTQFTNQLNGRIDGLRNELREVSNKLSSSMQDTQEGQERGVREAQALKQALDESKVTHVRDMKLLRDQVDQMEETQMKWNRDALKRIVDVEERATINEASIRAGNIIGAAAANSHAPSPRVQQNSPMDTAVIESKISIVDQKVADMQEQMDTMSKSSKRFQADSERHEESIMKLVTDFNTLKQNVEESQEGQTKIRALRENLEQVEEIQLRWNKEQSRRISQLEEKVDGVQQEVATARTAASGPLSARSNASPSPPPSSVNVADTAAAVVESKISVVDLKISTLTEQLDALSKATKRQLGEHDESLTRFSAELSQLRSTVEESMDGQTKVRALREQMDEIDQTQHKYHRDQTKRMNELEEKVEAVHEVAIRAAMTNESNNGTASGGSNGSMSSRGGNGSPPIPMQYFDTSLIDTKIVALETKFDSKIDSVQDQVETVSKSFKRHSSDVDESLQRLSSELNIVRSGLEEGREISSKDVRSVRAEIESIQEAQSKYFKDTSKRLAELEESIQANEAALRATKLSVAESNTAANNSQNASPRPTNIDTAIIDTKLSVFETKLNIIDGKVGDVQEQVEALAKTSKRQYADHEESLARLTSDCSTLRVGLDEVRELSSSKDVRNLRHEFETFEEAQNKALKDHARRIAEVEEKVEANASGIRTNRDAVARTNATSPSPPPVDSSAFHAKISMVEDKLSAYDGKFVAMGGRISAVEDHIETLDKSSKRLANEQQETMTGLAAEMKLVSGKVKSLEAAAIRAAASNRTSSAGVPTAGIDMATRKSVQEIDKAVQSLEARTKDHEQRLTTYEQRFIAHEQRFERDAANMKAIVDHSDDYDRKQNRKIKETEDGLRQLEQRTQEQYKHLQKELDQQENEFKTLSRSLDEKLHNLEWSMEHGSNMNMKDVSNAKWMRAGHSAHDHGASPGRSPGRSPARTPQLEPQHAPGSEAASRRSSKR